MIVGNPVYAIKSTINGIKSAFVSGPQRVLLYSLLWVLLGTACGLTGLGNEFGFLNPGSYFFFIIAGLLLILALVKYVLWKKNGLRETLPDGTILVPFGHTDIQPSGVIGKFVSFVLPIAPPATGSVPVTIPCPTCRQPLDFLVDSVQTRKATRLRFILISLGALLVGLALNIFLSPLFLANADAPWVFWVRLVGYIFLFLSGGYASALLQYTGVRIKQQFPKGHSLLPRVSYYFANFRDQKAPAWQTMGGQHVS
jgi:hypothetical protein